MAKHIFVPLESFKVFTALTVELKTRDKAFVTSHAIRLFVRQSQDNLVLQTHNALQPARLSATIDIRNLLDHDLDITVAAESLLKCLTSLNHVNFIKCTFADSRLQLEPAMFGGGLFGDDDYFVIESQSQHYVNIQQTQLISNYQAEIFFKTQEFRLRDVQLEVLKKLVALANATKKRKEVQAVFMSDGASLNLALNAMDVCSILRLLEHDQDCDVQMRLDLDQLQFFKTALSILISAKLGHVELNFAEHSRLDLSCAQIHCEMTQRNDVNVIATPSIKKTKQGWCTEANGKLKDGLKDIVVTNRRAEDIVKIQIVDSQINLQQHTDYASALFCTDMSASHAKSPGPLIVINRQQLYLALLCFHEYEKMQIHGLLTQENQLTLKPSSNSEEFVVLCITENEESE